MGSKKRPLLCTPSILFAFKESCDILSSIPKMFGGKSGF
jgi:hypothetical protein